MTENSHRDPNSGAPASPQYYICAAVYTIEAGDTLYSISHKYGVPVSSLMQTNNISNPYDLQIGQQICIPRKEVMPSPVCDGFFHTIIKGDTPYLLAKHYGVPLDSILRENPTMDPHNLMIGAQICIPGISHPPLDSVPEPRPIPTAPPEMPPILRPVAPEMPIPSPPGSTTRFFEQMPPQTNMPTMPESMPAPAELPPVSEPVLPLTDLPFMQQFIPQQEGLPPVSEPSPPRPTPIPIRIPPRMPSPTMPEVVPQPTQPTKFSPSMLEPIQPRKPETIPSKEPEAPPMRSEAPPMRSETPPKRPEAPPMRSEAPPKRPEASPKPAKASCSGKEYIVREGDTLYMIAKDNNISLDQLIRANPSVDLRNLEIGMTLCLPAVLNETTSAPKAPSTDKCGVYSVQINDNLDIICDRFNVMPRNLMRANPDLTIMDYSMPGTKVCLPNR